MYEVLALDMVDPVTTESNNMWDILEVLGIEAARQFLLEEFTAVICADTFINKCHIALLADAMTYLGSISAMTRYGVHRNQSGPLTKSSFEECLEESSESGCIRRFGGYAGRVRCDHGRKTVASGDWVSANYTINLELSKYENDDQVYLIF